MEKDLLIYFPSRRYGGSELLFLEMLAYFKNKKVNVNITDYKDGVLFEKLDYEDNSLKINISDERLKEKEYYVISAISHIDKLCESPLADSSIISLLLLHEFHALNFYVSSKFLKKVQSKKILKKFMRIERVNFKVNKKIFFDLVDNNGVVYFNKNTRKLHQYLYEINKEALFVNLPYKSRNKSKPVFKEIGDTINFGWVSRLDKDLFPSLMTIISLLNKANTKGKKCYLHIIGDGKYLKHLKEREVRNVKIVFTGALFGDDLYDYLNKNIDIGIGRGTIILDFASAGIPSIVTPLTILNNITVDQFILSYERLDDYSKKYSLQGIMRELLNDYKIISEKTFETLKNYESDVIFDSLHQNILESKIQLGDLRKHYYSFSNLLFLKRKTFSPLNS
ncbi:MAG: hypothetical protein JJ971_07400 [Balneolaceae bacterium]|nr:hypothetical protein [Balneolaceae bacterium]MBO6546941.1 hypothetical protein [Balneolaceae bacterium]MBO6649301.1 hypothetical protein [Balneolaceae bacterium]